MSSRVSQNHIKTYILLYETPSGEEDVYELWAWSDEQAKGYARELCEENNWRFLAIEWAMNRKAM